VPQAVACHGNGLRAEEAGLLPGEASAEGRVPAQTQGRPERSSRGVRGGEYGSVPDRVLHCRGEPHATAWAPERMLKRPNRRMRAPHVRWGGRGEVVRPPPIPIRCTDGEEGLSYKLAYAIPGRAMPGMGLSVYEAELHHYGGTSTLSS
jgi:hypothetical protein